MSETHHRIGIVGLGKLGRGILFSLCEQNWVGQIHAYSASFHGNYSALENDLFFQQHKVFFHHTLEGLFSGEPTLLFITTGAHVEDFSRYNNRMELRARLYEEAIPHVRPVFEFIERTGYEGLVCIMTNPTGDHLVAAKTIYDIPPNKLTSFPPDTRRAKGLLWRCIENYAMLCAYRIRISQELILEKSFSDLCRWEFVKNPGNRTIKGIVLPEREKDLILRVVGDHGREIPLIDESLICGANKPPVCLTQLDSIFGTDAFREGFMKTLHTIGHQLMQALEISKGSYYTAPEVAVSTAGVVLGRERTELKQPLPESIYGWISDLNCFLSVPAIVFGSSPRVELDSAWWLETASKSIAGQLRVQADDLKSFYTQNWDKWGVSRGKAKIPAPKPLRPSLGL
jgi:hypothetical protein